MRRPVLITPRTFTSAFLNGNRCAELMEASIQSISFMLSTD